MAKWNALQAAERTALEPLFRRFIEQHAKDAHARVASVYLAWIYVQQGKLSEARRLSQKIRARAGVVRDFASVVEGAILIRQKIPHQALQVLEPLRGKLIDPTVRLL